MNMTEIDTYKCSSLVVRKITGMFGESDGPISLSGLLDTGTIPLTRSTDSEDDARTNETRFVWKGACHHTEKGT
jgi:hypothetical protein